MCHAGARAIEKVLYPDVEAILTMIVGRGRLLRAHGIFLTFLEVQTATTRLRFVLFPWSNVTPQLMKLRQWKPRYKMSETGDQSSFLQFSTDDNW